MCDSCRQKIPRQPTETPVPATPVKKTPSHSLQWQISAARSETSPKHEQIHRTTLKRQRDRLEDMLLYDPTVTKRTRLPGAGRTPKYFAAELKIVEWLKEQRAKMIQVDRASVVKQMLTIGPQYGFIAFKGTDGWFARFKNRHKIGMRMVTSYSRKYTDAELDEKQREYVTVLIREIESNEVSCYYIFNMDETPLFKDNPPRRTYDIKGVKSVPIKTTNHEKDRITLVLCVSILGELLPPLLIFKSASKSEPVLVKEVDSRSRVLWHCGQENAYNDRRIMEKWIREVFLPNRNIPDDAASMLTMDNVSFHHNPGVAAALANQKVVVNTFPPNTTCRLQPLDHSINGIIKRKITEYWTEWMQRQNPAYTVHGNLQQPQRHEIKKWVLDAVESVKPEAIRRSFRHCWPSLIVLSE